MPAEDVDKAVEAALAKVPDEELRAKIDAVYQQRFRAALEAVRGDVTDPQLRAKLDAVLHEPAYDAELTKLDALVAELEAPPAEPAPPPSRRSRRGASRRSGRTSRSRPPPQEPPKPAAEDAPSRRGSRQAAAEDAPKPPTEPPPPPNNDDLLARLKALPREQAPDDRLEVTYILATEPSTTHHGKSPGDRPQRGGPRRRREHGADQGPGDRQGGTGRGIVEAGRDRDREGRLRPPLSGLRAAARPDRVRAGENHHF